MRVCVCVCQTSRRQLIVLCFVREQNTHTPVGELHAVFQPISSTDCRMIASLKKRIENGSKNIFPSFLCNKRQEVKRIEENQIKRTHKRMGRHRHNSPCVVSHVHFQIGFLLSSDFVCLFLFLLLLLFSLSLNKCTSVYTVSESQHSTEE